MAIYDERNHDTRELHWSMFLFTNIICIVDETQNETSFGQKRVSLKVQLKNAFMISKNSFSINEKML